MIDQSGFGTTAATPDVSELEPVARACLFVLAGSLFAVDARTAREVALFDSFTLVPRAPSCLLGVANLRGVVTPIVDIRALLDLPAHRAGALIKALVIEDAPLRAAIAIEAALGLQAFTLVMRPPPAHRFALGLLPRGNEVVTLLDVERLLEALLLEMRRPNHAGEEQG